MRKKSLKTESRIIMTKGGKFSGRTIAVVNDLSIDEQLYLYKKTGEVKKAILNGDDLSDFKISNPDVGAYLMFVEPSTRTKESFLNAVKFHNIKTNIFDASQSSFTKSESYADTLKMLSGYSSHSLFIIRTRLEGVTRWLESALQPYAKNLGIPVPGIINGGDGKHEHPTQEFLDEYSFLEKNNFNTDEIHIALVGDLFHGRTVHSKADGLKIFKHVKVDLIAPESITLPEYYQDKMIENGFDVRSFPDIQTYLDQSDTAKIWYFTRLQLERMGEDILDQAAVLRDSVIFKQEYMDQLKAGTKFYHPLPRHKQYPTIPFFLDRTELNGWDEQAVNGYYTRIIELAMLGGKIGDDFKGQHQVKKNYHDDFIEEIKAFETKKPEYKIGTRPVKNGTVIDHIGKGNCIETIWDQIYKVRKILGLNMVSSHGVYKSHKDGKYKGVLSIPDLMTFNETWMKKLSAIAPECTLNIIENHMVKEKYRIHMPPRVYDFDETSCNNPDCISNPAHFENAITEFYRSGNHFICKYCDKTHSYDEIWNI